jgi:hypothetical protein
MNLHVASMCSVLSSPFSADFAGLRPAGALASSGTMRRAKEAIRQWNVVTLGIAENPRLAGQREACVVMQLLNFKCERRTTNPNMTAATKLLTEQEIEDLAEFVASAVQ